MRPNEVLSLPSFAPSRRWRIGLNVTCSALLLVAVLAMANYLSARHFKRFHWTASGEIELSPQTLRILGALTNQVKVVVLFDKTNPIYGAVADLLEEYKLRSPRIEVEHVDYLHAPARAKMIQEQYKLPAAESGDRVLFESSGSVEVVYAKDLSVYDQGALLRGDEIKRVGFKGEQLFSSAIYSLMDPQPVRAYFVYGHLEHDFGSKDNDGYSQFRELLEESKVTVRRFSSLAVEDVPSDCRLLIMAGPQTAFTAQEVERIDKYLNRGGRLLVLFNYASRDTMGSLLNRWGIEVGQNRVRDDAQSRVNQGDVLLVDDFRDHPVVAPLLRSRLSLIAPRSVSRKVAGVQGADSIKVTELVFTSPEGYAVRYTSPTTFQTEKTGAIPLIAAVEKGTIQGISADRGASRILVAGDSLFLSNQAINEGANRDLARNAVNWLLNRELLLDTVPIHPVKEYRVSLSEAEMTTVRWLFLGAMPGGVLFLGALVWLRRRN